MKLPSDLVDRCDAKLVAARSEERRRVSRTQLVEVALERVLELDDVAFARVLASEK